MRTRRSRGRNRTGTWLSYSPRAIIVSEQTTTYRSTQVRIWNPFTKCQVTGRRLFGKFAIKLDKVTKGGYPDDWGDDTEFVHTIYLTPEAYMLEMLKGEYQNSMVPGFVV